LNKDNAMQHDHWNEANEADRRYREYAARVGYGQVSTGRPVFGAMALGDGPRQHQSMLSEMQRLANAGDVARNQAQVTENEMAMRAQNNAQAAMAEKARRDEIIRRKEEKERYEREMRLREKESFGKNWANQTMASGVASAMNSVSAMSGGGGGGTGGVSMTMRGAGGQRIGGGSVSPLRSLVG
jgi:hypothetical protein